MCLQRSLLGLGFAVTIATAITAPVSAQSVIIINGGGTYDVQHPPSVGNFIYGSPISTPVPVNPSTGLIPSRTYHSYPHSYPKIRHRVIHGNPILVNPHIRNSTIVNPVIVKDSPYYTPRRERRVIITHPSRIYHPW